MTNYHHDHPASQNYAVDMVCTSGDTEGQKVYAPTDGVIVEAIGNRSDDDSAPDGNIIMIGCENGTQICLAHLMQGSVKVKKGDRVSRGLEIAACGQTGNAATPHLHIHAQNGEKAVPMVFQGKFLMANDRFTAE
jgi:murein DD-endopeptidase MepM/ murein hydrolase activator NlpD